MLDEYNRLLRDISKQLEYILDILFSMLWLGIAAWAYHMGHPVIAYICCAIALIRVGRPTKYRR